MSMPPLLIRSTFEAKPKILIVLSDMDDNILDDFDEAIGLDGAQWVRRRSMSGSVILDVDIAEKAVAWLKAHGVEQAS